MNTYLKLKLAFQPTFKKLNFLKQFQRNFNVAVTPKPAAPAASGAQSTAPSTSATSNTAGTVAPATPPPKSKDQLKVEALMERWPEIVRNPPKENEELKTMKSNLETIFKFHQGDKNYLKQYDLPADIQSIINQALTYTMTTDSIANFLYQYEGFLTDNLIIKKFNDICLSHKDLTPEFFDVILPQVKSTIAKADRQSNDVLGLAAIGAANARIQDKEFWDIIVLL